ncbi:MAG: deoxyribodipyrimidine photo-lyase [bacterium]|nr:deoxyribodipyrimidine photo-lyase [bacterium]
MSHPGVIVWFRHDLRLADNPALHEAVQLGGPVYPVIIFAPREEGDWPPGAASRVWLHHSLASLDASLRDNNSRLLIRAGESLEALQSLLHETGARAVYWNRRYEPAAIERDASVKSRLKESGVDARSFNASLLVEPWNLQTKTGGPYKVFTPFWKAVLDRVSPPAPLPAPDRIHTPEKWPASQQLDSLSLKPSIPWDEGVRSAWRFGEQAALDRLDHFLAALIRKYDVQRDLPSLAATSRMSPHLRFGEITPCQIWKAVHQAIDGFTDNEAVKNAWSFLREVAWREFAYHLLYHFPHTPSAPLREDFTNFPWRDDAEKLNAWKKGLTGYPIVDAGMRELWTTGWMHNRVRMIAASFLIKDLNISWRQGAAWFWDTLVDADLANNTLGWQWTAGCGADAAPYFRIFNPVSQGEKFDASGEYVRRWVPELSRLDDRYLHKPWTAPAAELKRAGVVLGESYPEPIVDHAVARQQALDAYQSIKK